MVRAFNLHRDRSHQRYISAAGDGAPWSPRAPPTIDHGHGGALPARVPAVLPAGDDLLLAPAAVAGGARARHRVPRSAALRRPQARFAGRQIRSGVLSAGYA